MPLPAPSPLPRPASTWHPLGVLRLPPLCLALLLPGCFGPGPEADGGFDSPDPAGRLYGIERAAETNDRTAIPDLVDSLSSDDPAVRMLSILTLERFTGQTLGYDHAAAPSQRREAVLRWRNWLVDHASEYEVAGTTGSTPSPAPTAPVTTPPPPKGR